jgi:hypothetical protein
LFRNSKEHLFRREMIKASTEAQAAQEEQLKLKDLNMEKAIF